MTDSHDHDSGRGIEVHLFEGRELSSERHTTCRVVRGHPARLPIPDATLTVPMFVYTPVCGHHVRLRYLLEDQSEDVIFCRQCRQYYGLAWCQVTRPKAGCRPATEQDVANWYDQAIQRNRVAKLLVTGDWTAAEIAEQVGCSVALVYRVAASITAVAEQYEEATETAAQAGHREAA